jgi:hypothetical protein
LTHIYRYNLKILISLLLLFTANMAAQENEIKNNSYYYPDPQKNNRVSHTIGLLTAELPEDIVETEDIYRAPLFYYRIKYSLPGNLLVEGSVETNIITYHAAIGPAWSYNFENFGISIGTDAGWWLGLLNVEGFDTEIHGWNLYPNFSMGYNFPHFTVTFKSELMLILDQITQVGAVKERTNYSTFSGYSFAVYLEQPLWKDNYIVLGLKFNFTRFYSPLWAAFPTFERNIYISEIIIGFNL